MDDHIRLSGREREIMDIIYAREQASATDVLSAMADPPSRVSVRTFLRILEEKGHLRHHTRGREFVYSPTRPKEKAAQSALDRVLNTFFGGSLEQAVAVHLARPGANISDYELKRLAALIRQARGKGK